MSNLDPAPEAVDLAPGVHHAVDVPVAGDGAGARVTVVAGEFGGERSAAVTHTPLVGLEVSLPAGALSCSPPAGNLSTG